MITATLYDILIFIPLAAGTASQVYVFLSDGTVSYLPWLILSAVSALYITLLIHFRRRERLLMINALVTLLAIAVFYHPEGERIAFIREHTWMIKDTVIVLLVAFVFRSSGKIRVIRPILAAIGLSLLPLSLYWEIKQTKTGVLAVFLYAFIILADEIQRRSKKAGDSDEKKHLVFISPFIISVFILAGLMKTPSGPYGWGFVKTASAAIQKEIEKITAGLYDRSWESDKPVIGFSDRGRFGGNLTGSGYPVLEIKTSEPTDRYLYLSGRIFDRFKGNTWSAEHDMTEEDMTFDTLETLSAVLDKKGDIPKEEILKRVRLTMVSLDDNISLIFLPSKIVPGSVDEVGVQSVSFFRLNSGSPVIKQLMDEGYSVSEKSWDLALNECSLSDEKKYDKGSYQIYKDEQYRIFLPRTEISDRLKKHMDDVLAGADTDYEKLVRIEEMLKSFHYTETPGDLPDDIESPADYLDYFILEKRDGYCSYYATAFVLLARAYGIPARYVQGYRVDMGKDNHSEVSSGNTHAWPEAYIDGVGWTAFEPTPGLYSSAVSAWDTGNESLMNIPVHEGTSVTESAEDAADETSDTQIAIPWSRLMIPIVCSVCFAIILFLTDHLVRKRRYDKLSEKEKALWLCRRSMQLLKRRGFGRNNNETISEYRERMLGKVRVQFLDFLDEYERVLYSGKEVTEEVRNALESSLNDLKKAGHHIS